ncbi:hypothetical protein GGR02_002889 [Anoxybacillus voinovskiensis]|uniref:Uncharacterized protein n=1 Tax=Anoxybacteroides voinovskiense TaxID=230470 RepID=A0A840DYN8_9BACL|nr:hypothetical protein [Anoxybacillus voinovskiensis]MBB4075088.1 hypothetical protein [Anoxybacillus voinovskiensis]GGJ76733.1 hypothetical protein GCM10008982_27550 [Anoxybacillus voinovskiensis]
MEHDIGYDGTRGKRSHHHLKRTREDDWNTLEFGDDEEYELEYDEEEVEWDEGEEATEHESFTQASSKFSTTNDQAFVLNGKPLMLKEATKKATFAETHVRVTTYLEKNIYQIIQMLRTHNQIESITKLINDSVKEYLMKKYQ